MEIWTTPTIQGIWLLFQFKRDYIETPQIVWKEISSTLWLKMTKESHRFLKRASGLVRIPKCLMETSKISMSAKMHSFKNKVKIERMGRSNMAMELNAHLSQQLISLLKLFARVIQSEEMKICTIGTTGFTNKIRRRMKSSENWRQLKCTKNTLSSQKSTRSQRLLHRTRDKSYSLRTWATLQPSRSLIKRNKSTSKKRSKSILSSLNLFRTSMTMFLLQLEARAKNSQRTLRKSLRRSNKR